MEVDINVRVIQLVKSRPILYTKCDDFETRAQYWKEVANQLKVDVLWVKGRWHILRAKYLTEHSLELKGKHSNFKYMKQLSFLREHVNVSAFERLIKPNDNSRELEFNISEQDLQNDSDSDSQNMFLELEMDDTSKEIIQLPQNFNIADHIDQHSIDDAFYISSEELSQQRAASKTPEEKPMTPKVCQVVEVRSEDSSPMEEARKSPDSGREGKTEERESPKTVDKAPEPKPEPDKQQTVEPSKTVQEKVETKSMDEDTHRCEDAIFGELVTATLRKMDNEKKKAAKREIMNILFT